MRYARKHPADSRDNSLLAGIIITDALKVTEKGRRFSLRFKRTLWLASGQRCAYCGVGIDSHKAMHVDHFIPLCNGGADDIGNYVCSCPTCNTAKCSNSIEGLRISIALRMSPIAGIISPSQALKLIGAGVQLPISCGEFHFEMVRGAQHEAI